MGKVSFFKILFDKNEPIYFVGEMLAGKINIKIQERLKINSIFLEINGETVVHWTEEITITTKNRSSHHASRIGHRSTEHYKEHEKHFSFKIVLINQQKEDLYLEVGEFSYPFKVKLPDVLPTSFEHQNAKTRYSLHASIDIPWALDMHTTRSFTVMNNFDLNAFPELKSPFGLTEKKVMCCGPCQTLPVIAKFLIKKTGYVPGEPILFNIDIENQSKREVKDMQLKLTQRIKIKTTKKAKTFLRTVAILNCSKTIEGKSNDKWNSSLIIPSVCSSSKGVSLIDINYVLVFSFSVRGSTNSTDMTIPISIGTVPFKNENQKPTISYENCLFGAVEKTQINMNKNVKGEIMESDYNSFKPQYQYFKH